MSERTSRGDFCRLSYSIMGAELFESRGPGALAQTGGTEASPQKVSASELPTGKIGNVEISRITAVENLITASPICRDHDLCLAFIKHYNTMKDYGYSSNMRRERINTHL